jgi:hypothetical protein
VNPIRPNLPPVAPNPAPQSADAARSAAQRAFFELALGKVPPAAPTQAAIQAAPTRAAEPARRALQTPAENGPRPMRPGSLLDIRV